MQSHAADAWGTIAALLFTGSVGVGLAWIGRAYWLTSRSTRAGVAATAVIDRLEYSGPYVMGQFFAVVSYEDAAGISQAAQIGVSRIVWNRLREGRSIPILYSPADPQRATLGGQRRRALSEAAGAVFVVLGVFIVMTTTWILIAGLAGWGGMQPIRPFDQQQGVYLPPPEPRN